MSRIGATEAPSLSPPLNLLRRHIPRSHDLCSSNGLRRLSGPNGVSPMALSLAHLGTFGGGGVSVWENARLASRSGEALRVLMTPLSCPGFGKGGTGFQPVTCGSHSQDGCATLRTQARGKLRPRRGDVRRGARPGARRFNGAVVNSLSVPGSHPTAAQARAQVETAGSSAENRKANRAGSPLVICPAGETEGMGVMRRPQLP